MSTACEHAWELRREWSNMAALGGVRRFHCAACGQWGYRHERTRGNRHEPVRTYDPPVLEPRHEWDRPSDDPPLTARSTVLEPTSDDDYVTTADCRWSNGRLRQVG